MQKLNTLKSAIGVSVKITFRQKAFSSNKRLMKPENQKDLNWIVKHFNQKPSK
jgi:hypothetical protein